MQILTRAGLLRGLGVCVLVLGIFILGNLALLAQIHLNYYSMLKQTGSDEIGMIWLGLIFEPLSGAIIGITLVIVGFGMLKLKNWARILALALMYINSFVLAAWLVFEKFQSVNAMRLVQILVMYGLLITLLRLKWVKSTFS